MTEPPKRRLMRLKVTPEFLLTLCFYPFLQALFVKQTGLPEDAKAIGGSYDPMTNCFSIIVESAAFEEIEEGEIIPELPPAHIHYLLQRESEYIEDFASRIAEELS